MHPKTIEGELNAAGLRFAIVVSRFNSLITDRLLDGALDTLARSGARAADIEIIRLPGAYEMPVVVREIALQKRHDGILALGCVIRGDTSHFDYVAGEAAKVGTAALDSGIPVAFGVLTTNTLDQALDRAGGKAGNKGSDAASTAIEMANLLKKLRA